MTDSTVRCGNCGLPIARTETGIRHFGVSLAHSEHRCLDLLRAEIARLHCTTSACERLVRELTDPEGFGHAVTHEVRIAARRALTADAQARALGGRA